MAARCRGLVSLTRTRTSASLSLSDPLPGLMGLPLTVLRVHARQGALANPSPDLAHSARSPI
jgi:predicted ATP-grasp superfamily ATP-dependent carboligase